MSVDLEGPILNHGLNAVAIKNHVCVESVSKSNRTIKVNRKKTFLLNEKNYPFSFEVFKIRDRSTFDNKLMLNFIKYHFEIAINEQLYTEFEIVTHKDAIELIENEIFQREDLEQVTYKFLLINLINEKENEIQQLKRKLIELEENEIS